MLIVVLYLKSGSVETSVIEKISVQASVRKFSSDNEVVFCMFFIILAGMLFLVMDTIFQAVIQRVSTAS